MWRWKGRPGVCSSGMLRFSLKSVCNRLHHGLVRCCYDWGWQEQGLPWHKNICSNGSFLIDWTSAWGDEKSVTSLQKCMLANCSKHCRSKVDGGSRAIIPCFHTENRHKRYMRYHQLSDFSIQSYQVHSETETINFWVPVPIGPVVLL